jgi:sucrose phosphorylase
MPYTYYQRVIMSKTSFQDLVIPYLTELYGKRVAAQYSDAFISLLGKYQEKLRKRSIREGIPLERHTSILITYADSLRGEPGCPTLPLLQSFLHEYIGSVISTVHILPFFPSSSDDGFSVIDPTAVDPVFGDWEDIHALQGEYLLMVDFIANHLSRKNRWIQGSLENDPLYKDFIIELKGDEDLSSVFRPRALPLLTKMGEKLVWTTFSSDQVDVNYHNPQVLLQMTEILLHYLDHGASVVRLDAVAFLWKELGTRCIHHPKTHTIIQFFSRIMSSLFPDSLLVTETNVPHQENISYFGNGYNEATMVYNFSLPPLVFHTFLSGDATALSSWAKTLTLPSSEVTFFNFLASHDGIGLMPVQGLLSKSEIEAMAEHTKKQGGYISRRSENDGSTSPYELNINYFSALSNITEGERESLAIKRFIAASAIMIFFKGVPGIYIHSLIGSKNWSEAPSLSMHPRKINREKIEVQSLRNELSDPHSRRSVILKDMLALLSIRKNEPALSPLADQEIIDTDNPGCFAFLRTTRKNAGDIGHLEELFVAVNISANPLRIPIQWSRAKPEVVDLITNTTLTVSEHIQLMPYQVVALQRKE